MDCYSCQEVNSPCKPLHLQPSSVVLVHVAVALSWRGEVMQNQPPAAVFQAEGSEWRSHCCQVQHSHSLSTGTAIH